MISFTWHKLQIISHVFPKMMLRPGIQEALGSALTGAGAGSLNLEGDGEPDTTAGSQETSPPQGTKASSHQGSKSMMLQKSKVASHLTMQPMGGRCYFSYY